MKRVILTFLTVLAFNSTVYCQSVFNQNWAARFQEVLDSVRISESVMGAAAAVLTPEEGIWNGISGNSTPVIPLTPNMRLGIGSNTKLFVAVTILKLWEENILTLDDHLYQWIPHLHPWTLSYPNIDSTITVRQVLTHQSGIRNYTDQGSFWTAVYADTAHVWTAQEILSYVPSPLFEPGTAWSYSNTNYILAGMIIDSASGESWIQKVHEYILDPLNMDSTFIGGFEPATGPMAGIQNWSASGPWYTYPVTSYFTAYGPAGAILSTPSEMVQWYNALFTGEIITDASLQQLLQFEPASHFGLAVIGDADETLKFPWYNHGGQVYNHLSQVIYDIKTKSMICLIKSNYPSDIPTQYPFINPLISVLHNEYPVKQHDAELIEIVSPHEHTCTETVTPEIILKNSGTLPLTSINIFYQLDSDTLVSFNWTGSLNPGDTAVVQFAPFVPGEGKHSLKVYCSDPNNVTDGYPYNDTIISNFIDHFTNVATFPYYENFEDQVFPPLGWSCNPDVFTTWGRTTLSSYSDTACAVKCNYWDLNHIGHLYNLDLPMIDLTGTVNPTLAFTYAYNCTYTTSAPRDTLKILISNDCGLTWETLFYKGGWDLKTANSTSAPFFPRDDQWVTEYVSLQGYTGNVIIRFQNIEGSSNNLFIDDVQVAWPNGTGNIPGSANSVLFYPNPVTSALNLTEPFSGTISIIDINGREILNKKIETKIKTIDIKYLSSGIYILKLSNEAVRMEKFIKQ